MYSYLAAIRYHSGEIQFLFSTHHESGKVYNEILEHEQHLDYIARHFRVRVIADLEMMTFLLNKALSKEIKEKSQPIFIITKGKKYDRHYIKWHGYEMPYKAQFDAKKALWYPVKETEDMTVEDIKEFMLLKGLDYNKLKGFKIFTDFLDLPDGYIPIHLYKKFIALKEYITKISGVEFNKICIKIEDCKEIVELSDIELAKAKKFLEDKKNKCISHQLKECGV